MNEELQIVLFVAMLVIVLYAYPALCFYRIALKSRTEPSWLAWVPIGNLFLLCRLARSSGLWILLMVIPYVGPIFALVLFTRVPRCLGVNGGSRLLAAVPVVNYFYFGYLAFRTEPGNSIAAHP